MNFISLFKLIMKGNSYLRRANLATFFVMLVFLLIIGGVIFGEFYGFQKFLEISNEVADLKSIIVVYSLLSLFAIIFALVFAEALISSPYLFFKK